MRIREPIPRRQLESAPKLNDKGTPRKLDFLSVLCLINDINIGDAYEMIL